MEKVYLDSDFVHKTIIKAKGGKWDAKREQWYLIDPKEETLNKILNYGCVTYWSTGKMIYPKVDIREKIKPVDLFIDSDEE